MGRSRPLAVKQSRLRKAIVKLKTIAYVKTRSTVRCYPWERVPARCVTLVMLNCRRSMFKHGEENVEKGEPSESAMNISLSCSLLGVESNKFSRENCLVNLR